MKTIKSKTLLLSLLLALSLNVAHADNFGNIFNGIKDKISDAGKVLNEKLAIERKLREKELREKELSDKAVVDETIVDNSLLELTGVVSTDVKWLMIQITKNDFQEQLIIAVNNGLYQTRISLQDGAGAYDIALYLNTNIERYTNYTLFKKFTVENSDIRDMSFLLPTLKVQADDPRIKDLVASLTKDARDDEEAFLAIYKYVTSTIKYDYVSLNNGTVGKKDYNAINTLLSSIAVCEGYANLLAAMSRAYGIRTKVIFGQAKTTSGNGAHAWNEVFIHDEWRVVDATWDAGSKKQIYLFMNTERFALDHIKETEMKY
jgi:hypothetical protein